MTGARIEFELDSERVTRQLRNLLGATGNLEPVFEDIAGIVEASVRLHFKDQKGPDGKDWVPSLRVLDAEAGRQERQDTDRLSTPSRLHHKQCHKKRSCRGNERDLRRDPSVRRRRRARPQVKDTGTSVSRDRSHRGG